MPLGSAIGSLMPAGWVVVGLIFLIQGTLDRSSGWPVWMAVVGAVAVGLGASYLLFAVRKVQQLLDGRFRFVAVLRQLCVKPDELESANGVPVFLDLWGVYPFRLRSRSGSIFVNRHMPNGDALEELLRSANPAFHLNRAWTSGSNRDEKYFDDPWKDDPLTS